MSGVDGYAAALAELEAVRRDAALAVVAQEQAAEAARTELARVRERVALQRVRLIDLSARLSGSSADVDPHPAERATAASAAPSGSADPTPGAAEAVTAAWALLDAADGELRSIVEGGARTGLLPGWPPAVRAALPYLWCALLALIAVILINAFANGSPGATRVALLFDLAVPVGAFLLGLFSVRLLFGRPAKRGVALGALICCVPLVLGVALTVL